ncbi:hypothetical protein [Mesorhizobium sp. LjNodule214]|uniref:hypothetical protein n=1 Tax=Mesorhizobium sp. LjNodule214 TaxID=3342252 RepID=UPI003ECC32C5
MKYTEIGPSYWTKDVDDPHGLLAKSKLSVLMQYDKEASRRDRILWDFHLGWSDKRYGHTSLAGVRTIHMVLADRSPNGKSPLSQRHINEGNRALCKRGYITEIDKGAGRNASRFSINWDLLTEASEGRFPPSVSLEVNANDENSSVSPVGNASVSLEVNAKGSCVSHKVDEDLSTSTRLKTGLEVDSKDVSAAPRLAGLSAATAAAGFEDVWKAYGKHGNKTASREAYALIAPDETFANHIAARAASWAASAKPGKGRMPLEKWLAAEKYDEADRKLAEKPTKPAKPKAKEVEADNDNEVVDEVTPPPSKRDQEYIIEKAHIEPDRFGEILKLMMRGVEDGLCRPRQICVKHRRPEMQEAGMAEFVSLANACGIFIGKGLDADDFVGRRILITADNQVREPKDLAEAA